MTTSATIGNIAHVIHEANRVLQTLTGEEVNPPWDDAPEWMQESTIAGVVAALKGFTPEQLHNNWAEERVRAGWVWGPVKNAETKTHPCLVPYEDLPENQRVKDRVFHAIVAAMRGE